MIICLTREEVRRYADEIRAEFDALISNPRLAGARSSAKQWGFFRHCFNTLMGDDRGDFDCGRGNPTDYSHEITGKLRAHYLRRHLEPIRFRFWLEDKRHEKRILGSDSEYPCTNGYLLLIIPTDPNLKTMNQVRGALVRVIDEAINVEFNIYSQLPEIKLNHLESYFVPNSPAHKQILTTVDEHNRNAEVISNPGNPSTRPQLRSILSAEVSGRVANVWVEEYWNLHWFSTHEHLYAKTYLGQNKQRYTLIKHGDLWLVQENSYSPPRKAMP